jgi:hypothetical protein
VIRVLAISATPDGSNCLAVSSSVKNLLIEKNFFCGQAANKEYRLRLMTCVFTPASTLARLIGS